MKREFLFILILLVSDSCTNVKSPDQTAEQIALDYVFSEIIDNPGVFKSNDSDIVVNLWPPIIDSTYISKGLFHGLYVFGTTEIREKSRPYYNESVLVDTIMRDTLRNRSIEYLRDFNDNSDVVNGHIRLPANVREMTFDMFQESKQAGVFVQVKYHLESRDELLVEISFIRSDFARLSIIVFLGPNKRIKGWNFGPIIEENDFSVDLNSR